MTSGAVWRRFSLKNVLILVIFPLYHGTNQYDWVDIASRSRSTPPTAGKWRKLKVFSKFANKLTSDWVTAFVNVRHVVADLPVFPEVATDPDSAAPGDRLQSHRRLEWTPVTSS